MSHGRASGASILFCTLNYAPGAVGGAEHQARLQAEALVRLGYRVTVVCPREPGTQSGMLNETQRWRAVPRLLEFTTDGALDGQTRGWVFQALRDITGQSLPPDAWAWKRWYEGRK